jgi:hypothetical protein
MAVALAAGAAFYLTEVARGLLVLFGGHSRCQQNNAYLGLALLLLVLVALADILAVRGESRLLLRMLILY